MRSNNLKQVTARVVDKGKLIPGLYRPHGRSIDFSQMIRLSCPEIAREARPGQFVMVDCGEDCLLPRPFSIHRVIDKEDVELYFAVLEGGRGTGWLSRRQAGDDIRLLGPLGNGFSISSASHNLLLVAGGMGVAPLYFLAEEALSRECSVTLLYGTASEHRYPEDLLPPGLTLVAATDDGTVGYHGPVTDLLPDFIGRADQVFACGPLPMYRALAGNYPRLKNRPVQVSLEVRMACGRGVCYGCTIGTKDGLRRVCEHGPVFALDTVLWDGLDI